MLNQTLQTQGYNFTTPITTEAKSLIPKNKEFEQNYIVHRMNLKPLEISKVTRDDILMTYDSGKKFVQIDEYTIMLNNIIAIEPLEIKKKKIFIKLEGEHDK